MSYSFGVVGYDAYDLFLLGQRGKGRAICVMNSVSEISNVMLLKRSYCVIENKN